MKSFFIVTFWSIFNKIFALFRVQLTQRLLGASMESDGFHLSFRMIGFFRSIFTDGSFYGFFTSYFAKYDKKEDKFGFALGVMFIFSGFFLILNVISFFFPLALTKIFTLTFKTTEKIILISHYAKYMFSMSLSMFLCSLFSAILNYYKEFFHSSIGLVIGSMVNVLFIYMGISKPNYSFYLIMGTVSYSFIHALYMAIIIFKKHYVCTKAFIDKKFFHKISFTGLIQVINQLIYLLMSYIFMSMKPGSYSYVEYAERITYFVFTLVAGNLSSVIAPVLSQWAKDEEKFQQLCNKFLSMCLFLCIFPTFFIVLHHDMIINTIYTANSKTNLSLISVALKHSAIATPFWCLQRVLLTFFISRGQLKEQNITNLAYKILYFLFGILTISYDSIGVIWSMNLALITVVLYLFITGLYKKIFTFNINTIIQLIIKTLSSYILLKYVFYFLPNHLNIWSFFLKIIILYILYCCICYKDVKTFFEK